MQIGDVMAGLCINALNAFSRFKGALVNPNQINEVIDFEI